MWPMLKNWNARRSGAALTLVGQGPDGKIISIPGVTLIAATGDGIIAKASNGKHWRLAAQAEDADAPAEPAQAVA